MPRDKSIRPRRKNDQLMDKDIEAFYATIPDGEYPVAEIQELRPHPIQVNIKPLPAPRKAKQRVFQGTPLEPTPIETPMKAEITSHHDSEVLMVFEGGKLVAFRFPDGTRREVTQLHTEKE